MSRGARKAYFIENAPKAISCIQQNLTFTKMADRAIVLKQDVFSGLSGISEKNVDVIFMDPPYGESLEKEALLYLKDSSLVKEDALIVVEAALTTGFSWLEEAGFTLIKEKKYKTNKHMFIKRGTL